MHPSPAGGMIMRFLFTCALLASACLGHTNGPATSSDSATQLNADRRYSHNSNGEIIFGPSDINQRVLGQRDAAGNVHVTTDHWFLTRADQLNAAQLRLAELARERAASPEVSQLAMSLA